MLFLLLLNILLYYLLQIAKVRLLSKKLVNVGVINPFTIIFFAQLPVDICRVIVGPALLLDEGLLDKFYNFALLMTSVALLADYILTWTTLKISYSYNIVSSVFNYRVKEGRMLIAAFSFYLLYLTFFLLLASHSFGVVNWILSPRTGYQLHRTGAGQFWVFAISTLSVSFTLCCIYVKRLKVLFLLFGGYVISAFLLGSKAIILDFFIFFLIVLWVRRYRYFKTIMLIGVPLALAVMVINFFGNLGSFDIAEVFAYFDYYRNSAMYFETYFKGKIGLFYGEVYLSDYWGVIPRALFPDKPYAYGITLVNEIFWPGAAEETNTPAFGGPVAYFADFGVLGVIIFSLLNPIKFITYFFLGQLLKQYNYLNINQNPMVLALFILFAAPVFLMNLIFPANIIFYIIVIVFIMLHNRLVLKK